MAFSCQGVTPEGIEDGHRPIAGAMKDSKTCVESKLYQNMTSLESVEGSSIIWRKGEGNPYPEPPGSDSPFMRPCKACEGNSDKILPPGKV